MTDTPYNIKFEGAVSGTVTSSNHISAINAYPFVTIKSTTGGGKTIVTIEFKTLSYLVKDEEWGTFNNSIFVNDDAWYGMDGPCNPCSDTCCCGCYNLNL